MIEKILLDYLTTQLSVPVYMEEPIDKPSSYVLIEKAGSGRENMIDSAFVNILSYADSLYNAAVLNELVKTAMYNSVTLDAIGSCKLNTDYNNTDTTTKRYRYCAVFDIVHY